MKRKVHTESEMVKAVQELESGIVQLEEQVHRHGGESGPQAQGTRGGEPQAQADVRRTCFG